MEDNKIIEKIKNINLKVLLLGFILGILVFFGVRFVTYTPPKEVHYHANFAVYIDGQREKFENPFYYQEITTCSIDSDGDPAHRVHMHDNISDLIHVHAPAVTWGNFFQNIGWNVGKGYIDTSDKLLVNENGKKLNFVLNGEAIDDITTKIIGDRDKLLVSYGDDSKDQLKNQFDSVPASAEEFDNNQDPASCSGNHKENTVKDRLKNLL